MYLEVFWALLRWFDLDTWACCGCEAQQIRIHRLTIQDRRNWTIITIVPFFVKSYHLTKAFYMCGCIDVNTLHNRAQKRSTIPNWVTAFVNTGQLHLPQKLLCVNFSINFGGKFTESICIKITWPRNLKEEKIITLLFFFNLFCVV